MAGLTWRDVTAAVLCACLLLIIGLKLLGAGEIRRTWVCKHRLHVLGASFDRYAADNGGALPQAFVEAGRLTRTWDMALANYLGRAGSGASNPASEVNEKAIAMFHCPSDTEPRGGEKPRSYSMPMYDAKREGWPLQPHSQGGLGLYLDTERLKLVREAVPTAPADFIPAIHVSAVPEPAWTAILVEQPTIRNVMRSSAFATTARPLEQWTAKTIPLEKFHRGWLNYLMLDGHVERLTIRQSGGHAGNGGVWTIRPWD